MALRFVEGFDHYTIGSITNVWNYSAGAPYVTFVTGRFGGQALAGLKFAADAYIARDLGGLFNNFVLGFAFKVTNFSNGFSNCVKFGSGSLEQYSLTLASNGSLYFTYNGTAITGTNSSGYFPLSTNIWYYIEVKGQISGSITANSCEIYVNGVLYHTLNVGQRTDNQITTNFSRISLGYFNNTYTYDFNNYFAFDDIYFLDIDSDTTGPLGECKVDTLYPTGAGASTTFALTGASSNFAAVNETYVDNDTSFIYSSTVGQTDTYVFSDLASVPSQVHGVQVNLWAKKDAAGTRQITGAIYIGSTTYTGNAQVMLSSYVSMPIIFRTNPATGVQWTGSDINAAQFGVTVSA